MVDCACGVGELVLNKGPPCVWAILQGPWRCGTWVWNFTAIPPWQNKLMPRLLWNVTPSGCHRRSHSPSLWAPPRSPRLLLPTVAYLTATALAVALCTAVVVPALLMQAAVAAAVAVAVVAAVAVAVVLQLRPMAPQR